MRFFILIFCILFSSSIIAQQVSDTSYAPPAFEKKYDYGSGPIVTIDEAHYNFHTAGGRYSPFASVLKSDGYTVKEGKKLFTAEYLNQTYILVISNALNPKDTSEWIAPNPSAFTREEINAVTNWVMNGGSLFLIADHMPFAGAAADLASSFGVTFYNGFAMDSVLKPDFDLFTTTDKTLLNTALTADIDSIVTFTGQAFDIPAEANPVLKLSDHFMLYMCTEAWKLTDNTIRIPAKDKIQLAYMNYGKGKIVFSGEAAMFSAQISGKGKKTGMNSDMGKNNYKLLLNIMHWLSER